MAYTLNERGEKVSLSWAAPPHSQVRCPVEGCDKAGDIITKAHCRIEHDMTRDQVKEKYGMPLYIEGKPLSGYSSYRNRWNSTSNINGNIY